MFCTKTEYNSICHLDYTIWESDLVLLTPTLPFHGCMTSSKPPSLRVSVLNGGKPSPASVSPQFLHSTPQFLPWTPFPRGCWHSPAYHPWPCSSRCSHSSWIVSPTPAASATVPAGLTQSSASPAHTSLLSFRPMYPATCWTVPLASSTQHTHTRAYRFAPT